MVKFQEVFKVAGKHSVRGFVQEIDEVENSVSVQFTDHGDYKYNEKFNLDDIGTKLFEDEKDLIRVRGAELLELAPPRVVELKYAKDFYGKDIQEGDFVIAMSDKPLYHKLEGYISRVYYLSTVGFEKMNFIDLVDEFVKPDPDDEEE